MSVILTIFGYSLNDTIVIYDRLRENTKLYPSMDFRENVNNSINQTLGRTIKTAFATFIAIMTVLIVAEINGLTTLRSFVIPMAFGIVSGSVSTITLSCPLWYSWQEHRNKRKAIKG
jgi:preprotein translocase SecF subunit